jgi:hypothetical protein
MGSILTLFAEKESTRVPQADEIGRIKNLIELVGQGVRNAKSVAENLDFDPRQSSYYGEAAEILGFIDRKDVYMLTGLGSQFVNSDEPTKVKLMVCAVLCNPIVSKIISSLQAHLVSSISKDDVQHLIVSVGHLHGETVARRAQTIMAWLRWLQQNSGVILVEGDTATLESQQRTL